MGAVVPIRACAAGDTSGDEAVAPCCGRCRHRVDDLRELELSVAGWSSLGSAYGAALGGSGLCRVRDCWVSWGDVCGRFSPG
jgi:hypothetical protein